VAIAPYNQTIQALESNTVLLEAGWTSKSEDVDSPMSGKYIGYTSATELDCPKRSLPEA